MQNENYNNDDNEPLIYMRNRNTDNNNFTKNSIRTSNNLNSKFIEEIENAKAPEDI